jgi:hypothetical protein
VRATATTSASVEAGALDVVGQGRRSGASELALGGLEHAGAALVGALIGADLLGALVIGVGEDRHDLGDGQLVVLPSPIPGPPNDDRGLCALTHTRRVAPGMAKNDDLFKTLRQRGVRKNVANAVANGGMKAEVAARDALADLEKASRAIRTTVLKDDSRSAAAKKAARVASATPAGEARRPSAARRPARRAGSRPRSKPHGVRLLARVRAT